MLQFFRKVWQRLWGRLRYCGAVHYLAGGPSLPPPLTPEQEKALLDRMAAGDAAAREELITHNLRLVVYLAKKYENSGVPAEDLVSIGTIGLIKAVNTFTPERSIKLATYASRCIENEILMYFRSQRKGAQDVSLSDCIETGRDGSALSLMDTICSEEDLFEDLSTRELHGQLRAVMEQVLTPREKAIVSLRYGLSGGAPLTQREIAEQCGISRSYVSRIEKKALQKLERALTETG